MSKEFDEFKEIHARAAERAMNYKLGENEHFEVCGEDLSGEIQILYEGKSGLDSVAEWQIQTLKAIEKMNTPPNDIEYDELRWGVRGMKGTIECQITVFLEWKFDHDKGIYEYYEGDA